MKICQVLVGSATSWGAIEPSVLERGCGGRETALLSLAREWAKQGHEVINFVPRGKDVDTKPIVVQEREGSHSYLPIIDAGSVLRSIPFDAVISWEEPQIFQSPEILERQKNAFRGMEMQVAHLPPGTELLDDDACAILCLSPWHEKFVKHQGAPQRTVVLPNGIDMSRYPAYDDVANRDANFIYSSSPDRGLARLLEAWPYIRESIQYEDPELHVCYGVEAWLGFGLQSHNRDGEDAVAIGKALGLLPGSKPTPGVFYQGKIGQHTLATLQRKSAIMAYPADTAVHTETGCISVVEACASGAVPVITDCDCLGDEFSEVAEIVPLPFDPVEYADRVVGIYKDVKSRRELAERGREFAHSRSWSKIAAEWIEKF